MGFVVQRFQPVLALLTLLLPLVISSPAPAQEETGAPQRQIVAFGDSLSAGYGVGPGESFPEQLQAALREEGYDVTVTNAGVSGDTTSGGLSRLDWSVPENADLVIVELGANDALRGVDPKITRENLSKILEQLNERGQTVILAGMLAPPNMGEDYAERFNPIFPELAEKYDVTFYPFFLEGVAAEADLNQADKMHPNAEGVGVIVDNIMPTVTEALDSQPTEG
ncbi:Lipolytic enzyme, G-D-S-L family protein [Fulvimarina pelagi HTCC2506]|uniref:Lipolytic enzyme, G-D-S-L family protein n=1 Tax=Fulvimarina pelagi HTCC2506 TaxID=314231 RepID=Q0G4Y6_9HYPH|nr:arylesterase [Fulvimarina pelagi]EAU43278.1 Lipolytic enzyme, G-D-S-L family protein [Fulvimarina pelagi HTCC2506]